MQIVGRIKVSNACFFAKENWKASCDTKDCFWQRQNLCATFHVHYLSHKLTWKKLTKKSACINSRVSSIDSLVDRNRLLLILGVQQSVKLVQPFTKDAWMIFRIQTQLSVQAVLKLCWPRLKRSPSSFDGRDDRYHKKTNIESFPLS